MSDPARAKAEAFVDAASPPVAAGDREDVVALLAQLIAGVETVVDLAEEES